MKKLLKITLMFSMLLMFCVTTPVLAANETKLAATSTSTNSTATTSQNTVNNTDTKSSAQVTSVSSVQDGELSFSDILNILLIATGVIIIFLAIAILIKLK